MRTCIHLIGALCVAMSPLAYAQTGDDGKIAPVPFADTDSAQSDQTMVPKASHAEINDMLSTHAAPKEPEHETPFAKSPAGDAKTPAAYQPKVPFGRADYSTKPIPEGPHKTVAVPVEDIDAVETSEPAPPAVVENEANPSQEAPEQPTEFTSPIFVEETGAAGPRKLVVRVLNKVTAQGATLNLKPGETTHFGQIDVTAITCQASAPNSLTDYAGLLEITEKPATAGQKAKALFHGWMYASSPSITALEHPVYDVTMVRCEVMPSGAKTADKPTEKGTAKEGAKGSKSPEKPEASKPVPPPVSDKPLKQDSKNKP